MVSKCGGCSSRTCKACRRRMKTSNAPLACRPRGPTRRPVLRLRGRFLNQYPRFQQRRRSGNQFRPAGLLVKNLAAIRPFFRSIHQTIPNRIQAHIFPFAGFAFARAEFVVVKTLLPFPGAFAAGEFTRVRAAWGHAAYRCAVWRVLVNRGAVWGHAACNCGRPHCLGTS